MGARQSAVGSRQSGYYDNCSLTGSRTPHSFRSIRLLPPSANDVMNLYGKWEPVTGQLYYTDVYSFINLTRYEALSIPVYSTGVDGAAKLLVT